MATPQKTYDDLVDEWLQKKRNGVPVGPMPGDTIQQITNAAERVLGGRSGTFTNLGGMEPGEWPAGEQTYIPATGAEVRPSDVTAQMGKDAGMFLGDLVNAVSAVRQNIDWLPEQVFSGPQGDVKPTLADVGSAVGGAVPSMATTAPLLATPLGLPVAVAKAYGEAYTPQADPVAGLIGATGMAVMPGAISQGARFAERAAEKFLLPSVGQMVEGGAPVVASGLRTAVTPATHTALAASRVGGAVAGGTTVSEGQRQAGSLASTGELAPVSPVDIATDLGLNLAFAAPIVRSALSPRGKPVTRGADGQPVFSEQAAPLVAEVMDRAYKAQAVRNAQAAKTQQYSAERGQRIAAAHQDIFTAAERGTDPTEAIGRLKAHWEEAAQVTDPVRGVAVLKSIADDANMSGIPDEAFHRVVAGMQGKLQDYFKTNPDFPGPETINELVRRGHLQPWTKERISSEFADSVNMMLGDYEGAKSILVNRMLAQTIDEVPGAMEAMRQAPVADTLTKTSMGQMTDAAKDAQYMESIMRVTPHLKDAVIAEGGVDKSGNVASMPLLRALYARDAEVSAPMFDATGPFQVGKKAQYDAWRDAIIQVASTYDPVTRMGKYQRSAKGGLEPVSFEEMVTKKDGKYTFKPRIIREMDRPGAGEAVRDAIAYVDEITGNRSDSYDEISASELADRVSNAPAGQEADRGLTRTGRAEVPDAEILADAQELGVDPKNFEKYLGDMRDLEQPGLGLSEQSPTTLYDIGLHLMSKVAKGNSKEMFHKYGERFFGKQDPATKKAELFQQWLLARLESEIGQQGNTKSVTGQERTDVHQLTKAQQDFYAAWRKVANEKRVRDGKEPIAEPVTFAEKREQYRHALRLYAGTSGTHLDMKQLFIDMLDDNKTYRNFLQKAAGQVQKAQVDPLKQTVADIQGFLRGDNTMPEPVGAFPDRVRALAPDAPVSFGVLTGFPEEPRARVGVTVLLEPGLIPTFLQRAAENDLIANRVQPAEADEKGRVFSDRWEATSQQSTDGLQSIFVYPKPRPQQAVENAQATSGSGTELNMQHKFGGFTTPIFDALRVGESFGRRIGLDEAGAKELGATTAKFVQAFPEIAGFGIVQSPSEPGLMGLHVRDADALQGPAALLNLDVIDARQRGAFQKLTSFLMTTAHELAHVDTKAAGVYNQQRVDSKNLLKAMFSEIGPDGTIDLLHNIEQIVLPPQFRPQTTASIANQGSGFEEEAFSRFMEYAMLGALTKDSPWAGQLKKTDSFGDALHYLPDEVQAGMHLAFRDLTNVFGAIIQYYDTRPKTPENKASDRFVVGTMKHMIDVANKFLDVDAAKLAQFRAVIGRQQAMFQAAASVDLQDPVMVRTALDLDAAAAREVTDGMVDSISPDMRDAMAVAQTAMFGGKPGKLTLAHERALGTRIPPWSHWISLSYQAMLRFRKEGNPLAETVMYKLNDLEKAYFRLNRQMHDPFMVVDEKGRLKYDPTHPLLRILQRSDPSAVRSRVVLSDLARYANELGRPVLEDGQLAPHVPDALQKKLTSLAPEDQQGVLKGLESLLEGTKQAATVLLNDRIEASAARIGAVLMTVDKTMFSDKVFAQSKAIVETSVMLHNAQKALQKAQKDTALAAQLPAVQQRVGEAQKAFHQSMAGLQGEQIVAVQSYLFGKGGIAPELANLEGFFKSREGWFTTESRPGRYFIQSHKPDGTAHYTSAENLRLAKQTEQRLAAAGHTGILATDRQHPQTDNMIDAPDAVLDAFIKKETTAWNQVRGEMEKKLSPADLKWIDDLGYVPGMEVAKGMETKSIKRYMQERQLTSGREELDIIDAFQNYTSRLAGSVARRGLTREVSLIKQDPRLRNEGEFKQVIQTMQDTLLQPLTNGLQTVRAGLTARYLGLPNFVGPMIEMLQSAQGVLPYFIQETDFKRGVATYKRALSAPALIRAKQGSLESRRVLESAKQKELIDPRAMTKQEATLLYYERQKAEGGFKQGPVYASGFSRNHQILEQAAFGLGASKPKPWEQQWGDPLYWAAQMSMSFYSTASDYNSRVAFLGALDMLYERGVRGNELYQGAAAYQNLYTHGGGKANAIGYVNKMSNPLTRSAWGLTEVLQRYMFGNVTMQKDMFDEMIGRVKGSTPRQRKSAGEAFATAQFVQFLLAGAMGITGVGIGATVVQKLTGKDPKQALRKFWFDLAERLGADEPLAVLLANYAQNGMVSNSLGVDVSNRVTMNSFLGFNEYDGFNTNELTGVVSSSFEDLWKAGQYVAQGQMVKAGRQLASPSMRPYIDLTESKFKYGDFAMRDQSNNKITDLSPMETVGTAIGLRPQRYRLLRDAKRAETVSDQAFQTAQEQKLDDLSLELRRGNTKAVLDYVSEIRTKDRLQMPQPIVRSIIDRAVAASQPQDVLATGPVGNAPAQREIAQTFGNVGPRQSEVDNLRLRTQLNAQTGFMGGPMPTAKEIERAGLIDALVKQRGLTRAEASRMVGLMGY